MDKAANIGIQWEKINVFCCGIYFPFENIRQHQEEFHPKNVKVPTTSKNVTRHVKTVHSMNDESILSCEYCGKNFKNKSCLANHISSHTGEKNFTCLFCDKKFRRAGEAKQCENKHNGIFRHSCHLCEFKTNNKWHLDRHVNAHLKVKPYSCPACKSKTFTKSELRNHIRRHHEIDGSIISHLEATYPQMYNASESDESWRNDPFFQKFKPSTRKRKLTNQDRVEYPKVVRNSDNNNSADKKKRKLFSPKSQKSELFPEGNEGNINETPRHLKVQTKSINISCELRKLLSHEFQKSDLVPEVVEGNISEAPKHSKVMTESKGEEFGLKKLLPPKSQNGELFPEVNEINVSETPSHSKDTPKIMTEDCGLHKLLLPQSQKCDFLQNSDLFIYFISESNISKILRDSNAKAKRTREDYGLRSRIKHGPTRFEYNSIPEANQTI